MQRDYLLTGVTGFLGKVVLEELLRRRTELGVERVYVLIRPKGPYGAGERFTREVASSACFSQLPAGWTDAVEVVPGGLDGPAIELDTEARERITERVTHAVHAAAAVDFGLPLGAAARANVATALNLLELARECRGLRKFVCVSTAYATPHPGDGAPIDETLAPLPEPADDIYRAILEGRAGERELLARTEHPNTYTLTKSLAEHLLVARRGHVPLAIVRPSIISASRLHPFPGWIDSIAGFGAFVVLLGTGHMRAVIADPEARLDLVPVDDVATHILLASQDGTPADGAPTIRHAVTGVDSSPTMRECWEVIRDFFSIHRVDRWPSLPYLGPPGLRFAVADTLHHRLSVAWARLRSRRTGRFGGQVLARVTQLNTAFPYFTRRSFAFRTNGTVSDGFQSKSYVALVCRGVYRHILGRDDTEWLLAGREHGGHRGDLRWVRRQPQGTALIRATAWICAKVLRRCFDRVTVDVVSFERARRAAPEGSSVVVVPTHRSYFDFVLCSYLFFARPDLQIPIPYVAAATEFARLPLLGRILRSLHAFYLARGPRRENKELMQRVNALIQAGKSIEFFIEGTRSRSRAFLPPKRGLLRCLQATGRTCTVLPVAISYDRVAEEAAFARELAGGPKPPMRLGALLAWTWRALRRKIDLGRVHLACGVPVILAPDGDVHAASREVVERLRDATVATPYHLRGFLARHRIEGVDVSWLRRAIEQRGGRVLESRLTPADDIDPQIAEGLGHHFAHRFRDERPTDERMQALLHALFGPASTGARGREAEPAA